MELQKYIFEINKLRNGLFHLNWKKLMNATKKLGWDFSQWEKEGSFIIYPNLVYNDDTLASKVFNLVIDLLEDIFLPEKV
jgi:hypothetical protein